MANYVVRLRTGDMFSVDADDMLIGVTREGVTHGFIRLVDDAGKHVCVLPQEAVASVVMRDAIVQREVAT